MQQHAKRPIPKRVSLFVTCLVDQLLPAVGESTVRVLERLGIAVDFPSAQTCCGQPAFNSGFHREARTVATSLLKAFQDSEYVVTPSGSCAAMVKNFYPSLFSDDSEKLRGAKALASKVHELSDFLVNVLGIEDVGARYNATVTYHPSCHLLRELGIDKAPRQLLSAVKGLTLVELPDAEECCGFGGAFSVKHPHISEAMLADKVKDIISTGAEAVVACDVGCLMNIGGYLSRRGLAVKPLHLAQVLEGRG